ncbi:PREDICTED: hyaluronidase PH-20-like [Propithecus coquereli]|uniref:hyaluronidase PH-20-like n=1 Tax=Propithecus coquereli TaxID=379532 RepID=UPI00063F5278|nr:PREDICTED: hyaluronidase PH-20-like [Propithecus coquereli]
MKVLRFKHIFFGSFDDSSGVSQTVFTFLLIPCCLTLDFRAPPLIPNVPFLWAWNAPTELCVGALNEPLDLSLFSLVGSPRKDVIGQDVTIFYVDRLGYYPYIGHSGTIVYGGIPQNASLQDHLDKARKDILYYIPTDHVGLAVIDWEEWRPTWARNWKPKDIYKTRSIDLVRQKNTSLSVAEATKIAQNEFETAGKDFMRETLKLGKLLRSNHLWGYYLFPDCYNHNYRQPGFNGSCFYIEKKRNDDLNWLWKESTALYPSIYLNTLMSPTQAALYVRNRVYEAIRISKIPDAKRPLPVFVYARLVFTDSTLKFLSQDDLVNTLGETIALGASGIVIWGSLSVLRSTKPCLNLEDYMQTTLIPYVINVSLAAKMCNQVLCQEKGVCTRKNWNSSDHLHLNPASFAIQIGKGGKYIVHGKPTHNDLQEFHENFHCSCFTNMTCNTRDDVKDISAINVCVADGICIDAYLKSEPSDLLSSWNEEPYFTSYGVSSFTPSAIMVFVNILFLTMSSAVNL